MRRQTGLMVHQIDIIGSNNNDTMSVCIVLGWPVPYTNGFENDIGMVISHGHCRLSTFQTAAQPLVCLESICMACDMENLHEEAQDLPRIGTKGNAQSAAALSKRAANLVRMSCQHQHQHIIVCVI